MTKPLLESMMTCVVTLRPRQNGRHFADDIFKRIFLNENMWISIKISLKFVPKGPINNIPALVQIMAWRRPGDKSLSEPMMIRLPTHICVTRPQWVMVPYGITRSLWMRTEKYGCSHDNRQVKILITCAISVLRKNRKWKYVYVFTQIIIVENNHDA